MSLTVQKYGGTSVGNPERIRNVARRVVATQEQAHGVVVVVSAMSGVTDNLIKLAPEYSPAPDLARTKARLHQIPVEKIGPYASGDRASWPIIETEGAREHPLTQ